MERAVEGNTSRGECGFPAEAGGATPPGNQQSGAAEWGFGAAGRLAGGRSVQESGGSYVNTDRNQ